MGLLETGFLKEFMGGEELARYRMGSEKHVEKSFSHHTATPLVRESVSFLSLQQIWMIVNFQKGRFIWATILKVLVQDL